MSKVLILLTSAYPNANGEAFIENEIPYLEKVFDYIFIICSSAKSNSVRYIPQNAFVYYNDIAINTKDKIFAFRNIFTSMFWSEFSNLFSSHFLNDILSRFKILLIELETARKTKNNIYHVIKQQKEFTNFYFYSYWLNYNAIALIFLKSKNITGKFFSRAHGWDLYNERSECNYLPLRNFIYQKLDAIFPISVNGKNYINSYYKKVDQQKGAKVFTSKLGTNRFGLNPVGSITNELTIVSCSMIYPNKQVDLLAQSLINFKSNQTVNWFHFGSYIPNFSEKHYEELLNIINNNKNDCLKIHLLGYSNNSDIMKFYLNNHIDIFINLSLSEGIPVSIMEAMSFGIPIIATAVGGTPEIVKNGFNGFLLSNRPTIDEVDKTITMFCDLSDHDKNILRQNSFYTWNTEYNAETNYKEFANKIFSI